MFVYSYGYFTASTTKGEEPEINAGWGITGGIPAIRKRGIAMDVKFMARDGKLKMTEDAKYYL